LRPVGDDGLDGTGGLVGFLRALDLPREVGPRVLVDPVADPRRGNSVAVRERRIERNDVRLRRKILDPDAPVERSTQSFL